MSPIPVVIALGFHLFPFRTEKLSPIAPMVLHTRGRVGRRRLLQESYTSNSVTLFLFVHTSELGMVYPSETRRLVKSQIKKATWNYEVTPRSWTG